MSHSPRALDQVVVYDMKTDAAVWRTPAEAKRLCDAWPACCIIEENHIDWKMYAKLAGPKPLRFSTPTDDPFQDD